MFNMFRQASRSILRERKCSLVLSRSRFPTATHSTLFRNPPSENLPTSSEVCCTAARQFRMTSSSLPDSDLDTIAPSLVTLWTLSAMRKRMLSRDSSSVWTRRSYSLRPATSLMSFVIVKDTETVAPASARHDPATSIVGSGLSLGLVCRAIRL